MKQLRADDSADPRAKVGHRQAHYPFTPCAFAAQGVFCAIELQTERNRAQCVHRVVVAGDCGTVVNPDSVARQVGREMILGLTAAPHGRNGIRGGMVLQTSFADYPLLGLAQSPVIATHIVPSSPPPTGVGEPGTPPIAPAVANAL